MSSDQLSGSDPSNSNWVVHPAPDDILGLLDIGSLAKLQLSITGTVGTSHHLGSPGFGLGSLKLGGGMSFSVWRVPFNNFCHSIDIWDEPFDKEKAFVVVKKPLLKRKDFCQDEKFTEALKSVLTELKILYHSPIRKHPNIIRLLHFVWDAQSDPTVLAPSLILEYAELGTLHDYQNPSRHVLHLETKTSICLDVAQGLSFLHQCGVIHGDVKAECVIRIMLQIWVLMCCITGMYY